jgi:ABC-type molybdenum transport system ATPase subunit/photorepair protein PhrA
LAPPVAEPEEPAGEDEEAMAVAKRAGSSSISEIRSTLRESSIALFRRSRTSFSLFDLLYFCEKLSAFASSSGIPSRRLEVEDVRAGRNTVRLERALAAATTDLCDLEDRACKERRLLFDD